ncbi:MAG: DUF4407 domain-containing protein [Actinomycetota bacterium]|nr:DUF4407 domain-containing protein [Actinomycetota bacterium]
MHNLLLWLSTADRDVLASCPEEEGRFVTAGGAVLASTGMAALSGTFTFNQLLHTHPLPAVVLGLAFALMIMNIERFVLVSIRRQRTPLFTLLSATPRIGLAFLMGLVTSIPLLLTVFGAEVSKQAIENRNNELHAARTHLARQFARVPKLQREQRQIQAQLNAITPGRALMTSPQYRALAHRMSRLQVWIRTTRDPVLVRSYKRQANTTLREIRPLRAKLLAQERRATGIAHAQQRGRLDAVRRELEPLRTEKLRKDAELERRFRDPPGLADRIKALDMLSEQNQAVASIKNVLWLFILAIDSLPAILKTMLSLGRMTLYERLLEAREVSTAVSAEAAERMRCEAAVSETGAYYDRQREVVTGRIAKQVALQKEMDDIYIEDVADALRPLTHRWAREAARRYVGEMNRAVAEERDAEVGPPPPSGAPAMRLSDVPLGHVGRWIRERFASREAGDRRNRAA